MLDADPASYGFSKRGQPGSGQSRG